MCCKCPSGMRPAHLDLLHSLLFGALAGVAAESSVYPLEVIRRRMQTMAAAAAVSASSGGGAVTAARVANLAAFRQAALDIWSKDRLRGLYSGIIPNTVQVGCWLQLALSAGSCACMRAQAHAMCSMCRCCRAQH